MNERTLHENLLLRIGSLATSIMLVGSHVENTYHDQSDVDFIIVCDGSDERRQIKKVLPSRALMNGRPSLDYKVFTEDEYNKAKTSEKHFFLWSCMQHAICLHGKDISKDIKLSLNLVVDNLWNLIRQTEEVHRLLDLQVHFSGCCFHLYGAASTMYFVKKDILKDGSSSVAKEAFIQTTFGKQYSVVRSRYYRLSSKIDLDSEKPLRIKSKDDCGIGPEAYEKMKEKTEMVLMALREVVERVQEKSDET
jgi:hypothetical protein